MANYVSLDLVGLQRKTAAANGTVVRTDARETQGKRVTQERVNAEEDGGEDSSNSSKARTGAGRDEE